MFPEGTTSPHIISPIMTAINEEKKDLANVEYVDDNSNSDTDAEFGGREERAKLEKRLL